MTNEEVARIFNEELKDVIKRFQAGGNGKITQRQKEILIATNIHFKGKPVNITCCADDALKACINFTKPYMNGNK